MVGEVMIRDAGVATPDPRVTSLRADTGSAEAIQTFGNLAGEAIQGLQKFRAGRAGEEAINVVENISELTSKGFTFREDGELDAKSFDRLHSADADEETKILAKKEAEIFSKSEKVFKRLGARFAQSGIEGTSAEARIMIENEVRNIAGSVPGFADVVQRAAANNLGFDPMGFTVSSLLSQTTPKGAPLTKQQIWKQDVDLRHHQININREAEGKPPISREAVEYRMSTQVEDQTRYEARQSRISAGSQTVLQGGYETIADIKPMDDLLSFQVGGDKNGKLLDLTETEFAKATIKSREADILESIRQIYAQNGSIEKWHQDEKGFREQISAKFAPVIALIENTEASKVWQNNHEILASIATETGWRMNPALMGSLAAYGEGVTKMFIDMVNSAGSKEALQLMYDRSPILKNFFGKNADNSEFMSVFSQMSGNLASGLPMSQVSTGDPAVDAALKAEVINAAQAATAGDGEATAGAWESIMKTEGGKSAFNFIAKDPKTFYTLPPKEQVRVKDNFASLVGTSVNNIASKLGEEGGGSLEYSVREDGRSFLTLKDTLGDTINGNVLTQVLPSNYAGGPDVRWFNQTLLSLPNGLIQEMSDGKLKNKQDLGSYLSQKVVLKGLENNLTKELSELETITQDFAIDTKLAGEDAELDQAVKAKYEKEKSIRTRKIDMLRNRHLVASRGFVDVFANKKEAK